MGAIGGQSVAVRLLAALAVLATGTFCGGGALSGSLTCAELSERLIAGAIEERRRAVEEGATEGERVARMALRLLDIVDGHAMDGAGRYGETLFEMARRYNLSVASDEAVAAQELEAFSHWLLALWAANGHYLIADRLARGLDATAAINAANMDIQSGRSISIPLCGAAPPSAPSAETPVSEPTARLSCVELSDRLYGAVRAGRNDARKAGVPEGGDDSSYLIDRLSPLLATHAYLGRETSGADTWVGLALSQGIVPDRNPRVFGQWVRALLAANWWHDLSAKLDLALRGRYSEAAVVNEMNAALLALRTIPERIFVPDCRQ